MTSTPMLEKSIKKNKTMAKESPEPSTINVPDERVILDTLYKQYGKPKNIEKEKVVLYRVYSSPAGWNQGDWVTGGFQMGRVTIFTGYRDNESDLYAKTRVDKSWFIGVNSTHIKVFMGKDLDVILEV